MEVAIESIAGGIPGLGKGVTGKLMNKLKNSPATLKLLVDILGEGGEGALSTYLTPALKRMTYDPNAENASAEEIIRSAAMDSALSLITQGGNLPASIAEDVNVIRARGQNTKTAPVGAEASVDMDVKTASTGEAENSIQTGQFNFISDAQQQNKAMSNAYDSVVNEGHTVSISKEALSKYRSINADPTKKLIAAIKDYYNAALKGTKVDVNLNGNVIEVRFENDGKRKSVGWRMSPEKAATFESLHKLFENAQYAYSEINRDANESLDVPQFHYFVSNARIDGVDIPVKLQVRDVVLPDGQETRYYTHVLQNKQPWMDKKDSRGNDYPGTPGENAESSLSNAYIASDETSVTQNAANVNSENITNGASNIRANPSASPIYNASPLGKIGPPRSKAEDVNAIRAGGQNTKTAPVGVEAEFSARPDDVAQVYRLAGETQRQLDGLLSDVAGRLGIDFEAAGQKSMQSMEDKVRRKSAEGTPYSIYDMKDHARGKLELSSFEQIPEVLRMLDEKNIPWSAEAVGPTKWGYRGFHVTFRDGNGLSSEIQLTRPDVWRVKLESDKIYEKWRNVTDLTTLSFSEREAMKLDMKYSVAMWNQLDLPDFSTYIRNSSSESTRALNTASAGTGATGSVQTPLTSSRILRFESEKTSNIRPDSVMQASVMRSMETPPSNVDSSIAQNDGKGNGGFSRSIGANVDMTPPLGRQPQTTLRSGGLHRGDNER